MLKGAAEEQQSKLVEFLRGESLQAEIGKDLAHIVTEEYNHRLTAAKSIISQIGQTVGENYQSWRGRACSAR